MKEPILIEVRSRNPRTRADTWLVGITEEHHGALKALSAETNIPMNELVRIALREFLSRVKVQKAEAARVAAIPNNRRA